MKNQDSKQPSTPKIIKIEEVEANQQKLQNAKAQNEQAAQIKNQRILNNNNQTKSQRVSFQEETVDVNFPNEANLSLRIGQQSPNLKKDQNQVNNEQIIQNMLNNQENQDLDYQIIQNNQNEIENFIKLKDNKSQKFHVC